MTDVWAETTLRYAAHAEIHSTHPIAQSIRAAYGGSPTKLPSRSWRKSRATASARWQMACAWRAAPG